MDVKTTERRRAERTEVILDAVVAIGRPLIAINCSVVDISLFGARLWLPRDDCPDAFFLIDVIAAVAYEAEVVWRRAPHVGVKFSDMMLISEERAPRFLCQALARRRIDDAEALMRKQRGVYRYGDRDG